jgi:hypothetical protein
VIRLECTPPHIYYVLDFCLHLLYLCTPALQSQSHVTTDNQSVSKSWFQGPYGSHNQQLNPVLIERCSRGNRPSERTPRKIPPHCYLQAAEPTKERITSLLGRCLVTGPDTKENVNTT